MWIPRHSYALIQEDPPKRISNIIEATIHEVPSDEGTVIHGGDTDLEIGQRVKFKRHFTTTDIDGQLLINDKDIIACLAPTKS
jgi:hypothetical protein